LQRAALLLRTMNCSLFGQGGFGLQGQSSLFLGRATKINQLGTTCQSTQTGKSRTGP
jgi:hypothetical protein